MMSQSLFTYMFIFNRKRNKKKLFSHLKHGPHVNEISQIPLSINALFSKQHIHTIHKKYGVRF